MNIAQMIDHSLLRPEVTKEEIKAICSEGEKYGFATVCINPVWVRLCVDLLKGSPVRICTVSGFPLGASRPEVKAKEAQIAIHQGADEIDMVANIGALKSGYFELLEEDIRAVRNAMGNEKILKVIIETAVLTDEEKIKTTEIVMDCGADFVKTSTGFGYPGATVEDVRLLKRVVGDRIEIKASGGIRDYATALKLVQAGASRIGTSSGVQILQQSKGADR